MSQQAIARKQTGSDSSLPATNPQTALIRKSSLRAVGTKTKSPPEQPENSITLLIDEGLRLEAEQAEQRRDNAEAIKEVRERLARTETNAIEALDLANEAVVVADAARHRVSQMNLTVKEHERRINLHREGYQYLHRELIVTDGMTLQNQEDITVLEQKFEQQREQINRANARYKHLAHKVKAIQGRKSRRQELALLKVIVLGVVSIALLTAYFML